MQQGDNLQQLVEQLQLDPNLAERLPAQEGAIVRAAQQGKAVHKITSDCATSESAVWELLRRVAQAASSSQADTQDKPPRPSHAEDEDPDSESPPERAAPEENEAHRPSQAEGE